MKKLDSQEYIQFALLITVVCMFLAYFAFDHYRDKEIAQDLALIRDQIFSIKKQDLSDMSQLINGLRKEQVVIKNQILQLEKEYEVSQKALHAAEKAASANRTIYVSPEETSSGISMGPETAANILQQRVFGGIGINIKKAEGGIYINGILPDGAAQKSGALYQGDIIIKINDQNVRDMDSKQVLEILRGDVGTTVKLDYVPAGAVNTVKSITLVREIVNLDQGRVPVR